jgi:hypothetical protein
METVSLNEPITGENGIYLLGITPFSGFAIGNANGDARGTFVLTGGAVRPCEKGRRDPIRGARLWKLST